MITKNCWRGRSRRSFKNFVLPSFSSLFLVAFVAKFLVAFVALERIAQGRPDAAVAAVGGHWFRKFAELMRPSGIPKLRVFIALNISIRTCIFFSLANLLLLTIPMSMFTVPSARSELRGTLPTRSPA